MSQRVELITMTNKIGLRKIAEPHTNTWLPERDSNQRPLALKAFF